MKIIFYGGPLHEHIMWRANDSWTEYMGMVSETRYKRTKQTPAGFTVFAISTDKLGAGYMAKVAEWSRVLEYKEEDKFEGR